MPIHGVQQDVLQSKVAKDESCEKRLSCIPHDEKRATDEATMNCSSCSLIEHSQTTEDQNHEAIYLEASVLQQDFTQSLATETQSIRYQLPMTVKSFSSMDHHINAKFLASNQHCN